MLKLLLAIVLVAGLAYCGATVKLGKKTFFGHIRAIWHSEPTQDLVEGVKEKSKPIVDRVERGVKAGLHEAEKPAVDAGVAR